MHLTNYSLNKLSDKFVKTEEIDDKSASKQTLSSVLESLGSDGELIFDQIKEICSKSLLGL